MRITLKDVAAKAGVSHGTVSLVLNNRTDARIGKETRERVCRVAKELGYEPNLFARSLTTRRTNVIGLIVPSIRHAFFAAVLDCAVNAAHNAGYQTLLDAVPMSDDPAVQIDHKFRGWQFDGVLVYSLRNLTAEEILGPQASRIPIVYLGQYPWDGIDCVMFDLLGGSTRLTQHLVERGYRRIAYVSPFDPDIECVREPRWLGYAEVCRDAGLPTRFIRTLPERETREAGLATAMKLASEPPDRRPNAIICHNDTVAMGAYSGIVRAGLKVPGEMAVAGFDGIDAGRYLPQVLTTVETPIAQYCETGINMLVNRIRSKSPSEAQKVVIPASLRVGETT